MTKAGYGTITNPLSLSDACDYIIEPGDTVYLRGGTYNGDFVISISGTAENPITFEPYQAEQVVIDGQLDIEGDYIIINGKYQLTVMDSNTDSRYHPSDDYPTWMTDGIEVNGTGVQVRNCIIHDMRGNATALWGNSVTQTLYGCVIYNNGYDDTTRGHGHGVYSNGANSNKTIKHNVMINGFELGLKVYTTSTNIDNHVVVGNTFANAGVFGSGPDHKWWNMLVGSIDKDIVANNETVQDNCTYHTNVNVSNYLGYSGGITGSTVTGNKFVGPVAMRMTKESSMTFTGNTFAGNIEEFTAAEYADNTYATFANMGNTVHVVPNDYITTAGLVTIYNQAEANTVTVDLTTLTGLGVGDVVHVHNVQDFSTDIQELTLSASKTVDVNMQAANRTVVAPLGWTAAATTFPKFGCFLVQLHEAAPAEPQGAPLAGRLTKSIEPVITAVKRLFRAK